MGKWILAFAALVLCAGAALAAGYRFHAENTPYYFKFNGGGEKQKIVFRDGMTLTGVVVEETADKIKVDADGAGVLFSRTEIQSIESVKGANPWTLFLENYKRNDKKHPLITRDKNLSLGAKFDHFIMEPSRIADDIRAKHPEITSAGQQAAAMEGLRAAQAQARAIQEKAAAHIREME